MAASEQHLGIAEAASGCCPQVSGSRVDVEVEAWETGVAGDYSTRSEDASTPPPRSRPTSLR